MSSTVEAVCVDPKQIEKVWPHVSHFLRTAYNSNPSDGTFRNTEAKILNGDALLWLAWDGNKIYAAAATEIWERPAGRTCSVLAVAGISLKKWKSCLRPIENYAKREHCIGVRLEGRPGWQRIFPDYHQPWIVLEKRF